MLRKITSKFSVLLLCFVAFLCSASLGSELKAASFAKGADVSWVPAMEYSGYKWYDKNGAQKDVLRILKDDYGLNSVRLRVFVNPSGDVGNGWCDLQNTINMAKRAKALGMQIMIDFHYSDSWADPGQQNIPAAWKNDDFNKLMDDVYSYTHYAMKQLASNGIYPEWVQVGNETNNGMLWNYGKASSNMKQFAWLINCGYDAVKAVSPGSKVIVHLANGNDNSVFTWMFNGLTSNGAKFDIIGMSLYPSPNNWSSLTSATLSNMQSMVSKYGKQIMICEVGMSYDSASASKAFVKDMVAKVKSLPNSAGLGVFYWEPEAYPRFNGYTLGACGSNGRFTAALEGFK